MNNLKPLSRGSTIGIISPASYEKIDKLKKNISLFKKLGFNIKLGKHIFDKYGYLAGYDSDRASDLMEMFIDDSIDGIVCYRGGFGCSRIVNYLDLSIIKKNPKIFCGYSDITLLLNLISSKCNFPTFHSPMCNSDFSNQLTKDSFLNLLFNEVTNIDLSKFRNIEILNKNDFSAPLCGGNLSIICSTLGTAYEIDTTDKILLIEEINESPYIIDRLLTQLISANKLSSCKAIILGHFTDCYASDSSISFTLEEVINEKFNRLTIPIIRNFPIGHSYPNIILPVGTNITFNANSFILEINNNIFK